MLRICGTQIYCLTRLKLRMTEASDEIDEKYCLTNWIKQQFFEFIQNLYRTSPKNLFKGKGISFKTMLILQDLARL